MKKQRQLSILIVGIIALWLTACGSPPLVKPEAVAPLSQTEDIPTAMANVTKEAIETNPFVSPLEPKLTATLQATPFPSPTTTPTATVTPNPLPPLDKNLQTIIFTTSGPQGPEIWRVQVDKSGQKAGPVAQIVFPTDPLIRILGLFPSPDGQRVAVGWVFGTGTTHVYVVEIVRGQLAPLFGEAKIDQRVTFLAWTPDSQSILVLGGTANPNLGNSAWLVNVDTHQYRDVNIKQVNEIPRVYDATFSPDGKMIAYAQKNHEQGGSEIWRISLNDSERQLLFKDSKTRVENVLWSPDGNYIAFTRWVVNVGSFPSDAFGVGELHLMKADGTGKQLLSTIAIHFDNQLFRPIWSPDSQKIAFVMNKTSESGKSLSELSSNLNLFDVRKGQINQLTNFENTQIIKPIWSRDGSQIAFLMNENKSANQFQSQTVMVNGRSLKELGVNQALLEIKSGKLGAPSINLDLHSFITWLPKPF